MNAHPTLVHVHVLYFNPFQPWPNDNLPSLPHETIINNLKQLRFQTESMNTLKI